MCPLCGPMVDLSYEREGAGEAGQILQMGWGGEMPGIYTHLCHTHNWYVGITIKNVSCYGTALLRYVLALFITYRHERQMSKAQIKIILMVQVYVISPSTPCRHENGTSIL